MGRDSAPVSGTGRPPFVPVGTPARGFGHLPHRILLPLLLRGVGVGVCGGCGGVRATGDPGNTLTRLPVVEAYDRRPSRVTAMPGPIAPVDDDARHLLPCAPEHGTPNGTPSGQRDERGALVVHCCLTVQKNDDQGNRWLHSSHRHYGNLFAVTSALRLRSTATAGHRRGADGRLGNCVALAVDQPRRRCAVRTECAPMLSAYPVPLVDRHVSNSPRPKERLASEAMVADRRQGRRNAGEPASADPRQLTGFVSAAQGEGVAAKSDDGVKDHRPRGTVSRGAPTPAPSGPSRWTDSCARLSCPVCPDNLPLRAPGRNRHGARSSPGQSTSGLSLR